MAREEKSAAIVVMEPKTGDILAMASYPQLNSWEMYSGVSSQRMQELQSDPRAPFINKAIQQYPPGSVFKVVLAAAALESGLIGLDETYVCTGSIAVGDVVVSCFGGEAHGEVTLQEALALSCNSYFIWLGQNLGRHAIAAAAERFKLGSGTGIPLEERAGNIPAVTDLPFLGNLAHFSIGQGQVLTTPLQLTRMMAIIANNGLDVYPRLVSEIIDNQGRRVRFYPVYTGCRAMQPATARRLKIMLASVVEFGTGQAVQSSYYRAIGKTGTAETSRQNISHSWFAGIAEINGKQFAATVFLEDSREGSAAAVFRSVMEQIASQAAAEYN
ncbi:MAG: penicillin-binding transpeptidase domain-containing protein [Firmicutes bacterium]|nr:penicillin-binding transpeptidase domain-containing protein [Bacillota bacterium]MCL5993355.1 penicillin-binding transpeptidase domain-containing protein [Bacillota bacterium]